MGRTDKSNSNYVKSPVSHYVSFNGSKGVWEWWDKETESDKTQDVLNFVVLDTRSSVTGWNKKKKKKMFSNLVKSTKTSFLVRCGKEPDDKVAEGPWIDIKDKVNVAGGKFTTNVFALADLGEGFVPVNIQLTTSALSEWMEFVKVNYMNKVYASLITGSKSEMKTMGEVDYYNPVFTANPLDEELGKRADNFQESALKPYLEQGEHHEPEPAEGSQEKFE